MVIDGATAYIMTMNLTNSAFDNNRDYAIVDRTAADVSADAEAPAVSIEPTERARRAEGLK